MTDPQQESLLTILEHAMRNSGETSTLAGVAFPSGRPFIPGVSVKFPKGQVIAADRVGMWIDGDSVHLAMWPAELQPQYNRVYSDPKNVEGLIALGDEVGWALNSNFHLAFRFAGAQQRWYPRRHLGGPVYVRQWIHDIREGRAGGRTREQINDPSFREWLLYRGYAQDDEIPTLDDWLTELSPGIKFHIRPSIEIVRTWPSKDALAIPRQEPFVDEVRAAIDQVLSALGELRLGDLQPNPDVAKPVASGAAPNAKALAREPVAVQRSACPTCHLIHAGECDW